MKKTKQLIPKRRFKEFQNTEKWHKKKLKDIANIVGGGTPSTTNLEYWDGDVDWYSPTEIGNQVYANKSVKTITQLGLEKSSAKILPSDKTILFTSRAGIGDMAILQNPGATNQGFQSLVLRKGIDTYFIYSMGHLIKKFAEKNASGSTFMEISGKTLEKMTLLLPTVNEQKKIGRFFQQLDEQINLQQRKLAKIKDLKSAYLSDLFPKEGEKYPKLRFEGFTEAWEQQRLGDLSIIKTGYAFASNTFDENGEYLVITNGNIQTNSPYVDSSIGNKINIGESFTLNDHVLNEGDILVTMDGTVGRTAKVVKGKQILAQRVGRLTALSEPEFLYQFLNTGNFFKNMTLISHGGTIKHISLTEISNYLSYVPPSREEQRKIGNFFKQLDKQIELQEQNLEKLEKIKQAYLNEMFV